MKRLFTLFSAFVFTSFLFVGIVEAVQPDVKIRLRPHCAVPQASQNTQTCPEFPLYDSENAITNGLKAGDALDLDIVLENPSRQTIQSVRAWIDYDATVLQGSEIRIDPTFPLVAPGEQSFMEENGLVKLGASNVSGGVEATDIVFARVTFTVLSATDETPRVQFNDFSLLGSEGHTQALVIEGGRAINVVKTTPKKLMLYFGENPPPTTIVQPTVPTPNPIPSPTPNPILNPTPNPIPTPTPSNARFAQLQPQGLRIMTDQDAAYLIWNPLTDPEVVGYNVYYGTEPGRYIQRRTVSSDTTGITIRGLPIGKRYYFAIAAFNAQEAETQFSYEVAVTTGDASSSTAPFSLVNGGTTGSSKPPLDGNVLNGRTDHVPGGTGLPLFALFVITMISFGSTFLYRRLCYSASHL